MNLLPARPGQGAPADVLAVLGLHLATGTPPVDPARHLTTYSPDALIPVGTGVARRHTLQAEGYTRAWADSPTVRAVGPTFTLAAVLDWQPGTTGGRLAAVVHDERQVPWRTAWLFEGPSPLVRAVCLLDGELPDESDLIARANAELAQWGPQHAGSGRPLSPLGLIVLRQRHQEPLPLISLPEARFTCRNLGDCCHVSKWSVPVEAGTHLAIADIPWDGGPGGAPRFHRLDEQSWTLAADAGGDCHSRRDGQCSLHGRFGWQPIPVCQIFPMLFTATPDSLDVTASFTCRTVGENLGMPLAEQTAALQERLRPWRQDVPAIPATIRLWTDGPPVSWHNVKALQACLLDILADRNRGDLASRVLAASRGLAGLMDQARERQRCPADPVAVVRAGLATPLAGRALEADALMGRLCGETIWDPLSLRPFGGWLRSQWSLSRMGTMGEARDDELATRYLRTVLFRKRGLASGGLAFSWGLVAWIAALWDRQTVYQSRREGRPIDRELQLDTARRLDQLMLHTALPAAMAADAETCRQLSDPATWLALAEVSG